MSILIRTEAQARRVPGPGPSSIRASEVISALSYALDLTGGQPAGHAVRTCVIGMSLATEIGLPFELRGDLYYALLIKDAGCSTNAARMVEILGSDDIKAKRDVATTDWTKIGWESLQYALSHVRPNAPFTERVRALFSVAVNQEKNSHEVVKMRCERGSSIARRIGLSETTALAIHSLTELWNGAGQPVGLRGEAIPLLSRIMNLAQTVDVFHNAYGVEATLQMARKRSGRWFDPALVKAFLSLAKKKTLWADLENAGRRVIELEPAELVFENNDTTIDNICMAFADVIDAKSPFTYRHSAGVAGAAVAIGRTLSLSEPEIVLLRRAALLHDIGKLSVSNSILDKPGKLTEDEWAVVRKHPHYSLEILKRVPGFEDLSEIAASHHEKLDGTGYFRNMNADNLTLPARILVVSDIYDALAAKRPYRDALPIETVFGIMQKDAPRALDAECFEALKFSSDSAAQLTEDLMRLSASVQSKSEVSDLCLNV